MAYPITRLRRLRRTPGLRSLVQETMLRPEHLIAPLFLVPGCGVMNAISSLPGQYHFSPDKAAEEARELGGLGVSAVLLFGLPDHKDDRGSVSYDDNGIVQQGIRAIKEKNPDTVVIADLCFCEYTTHGHCGVVVDGDVHNDLTLLETKKQAVSLAKAGADIIAPSGMMDGMVGAVREALDAKNFPNVLILAYSAKYASAYYGPFREAAQSAPSFGDRKTYQMDPANSDEAMREIELDIEEGADMVMVKPALPYLDIISRAKDLFGVPLAAYNVSGEYAMIKAAAAQHLIDEQRVMMETLLSIRRAGADMIISYFARAAAELLD